MNTGIDIVELDRVKSVKEGFIKHVLSINEIDKYNSFNEQRKIEFLGSRFACKEAIIKCLSGIEIPNMNELDIQNNEKGKPFIKYKDYSIEISISHEKHYAIAVAILLD